MKSEAQAAVDSVMARRSELCERLAAPFNGLTVSLEPLEERHRAELEAAARDRRIWEMTLIDLSRKVDFDRWWYRALAERTLVEGVPFAIRSDRDALIGSTRYGAQLLDNWCVEVGGTWLRPQAWRGGANAEAKLLMLTRAFEEVGLRRVEFKTAADNSRSRAALAAMGATEEGLLRGRHVVGGKAHDSVYYGVIDSDWPRVLGVLEARRARIHSPQALSA